jgi:hypothetical protein
MLRLLKIAVVLMIGVSSVACFAEPPNNAAKDGNPPTGDFFINLGDYAKGDGSDETAAIQKAIDAVPSGVNSPAAEAKRGGRLYIPRPKMFYGISKTLDFSNKWNITVECESTVFGGPKPPSPLYFKWIGAEGDQPMFSFNMVLGARIMNLSLDGRRPGWRDDLYTGMDPQKAKLADASFDKPRAKGLIGVFVGPSKRQEPAMNDYPGLDRMISFHNLAIEGCETGLWVGGHTKQTDAASLSFSDVSIHGCTGHGLVVNSTMAVVDFRNLLIHDSGVSNVRLYGGDVGFSQYVGTGSHRGMTADIELHGGGLRVLGAWSETSGPFILAKHEWHMYPYMPRVIVGVQHGCPDGTNTSIEYDSPTPLNLIGCSFRGDVNAGPKSGTIMAMGVTFGNPKAEFCGEGVTKFHRLVRIGAAAMQTDDPTQKIVWGLSPRTIPRTSPEGSNPAWIDPYLVDRRNWPGNAPPTSGVWQKGDGVVNVDPDPNIPAKAWRGWICVAAGEPGKWRPYGRLEPMPDADKSPELKKNN